MAIVERSLFIHSDVCAVTAYTWRVWPCVWMDGWMDWWGYLVMPLPGCHYEKMPWLVVEYPYFVSLNTSLIHI